ncbi:MAG: aminotransferase class III-fold pyridoxal phosphate-dependent enzyme, partial [Planctomycetota bacterium]|nr:aminotransferase class III-fold pyridoxal phosphate-dependent enzyme [Planctomycetota bacterium]
ETEQDVEEDEYQEEEEDWEEEETEQESETEQDVEEDEYQEEEEDWEEEESDQYEQDSDTSIGVVDLSRLIEQQALSPILVEEQSLPSGMLLASGDGSVTIDGLAGRCSSLGFNPVSLKETLSSVTDILLMDSGQWLTDDDEAAHEQASSSRLVDLVTESKEAIRNCIGDTSAIPTDLMRISPSADAAIDTAILMARALKGESCYRTIVLAGSDHGRTGMCRSASGIPELQNSLGPMMAGFTHIPPGDSKTLAAAIDEQTACVLISPSDLHDAAIPVSAEFLIQVRKLCDENQIPLILDESQLVFGASGYPATFQMLARISADLVIFSAGLFHGVSGGLILGNATFASKYRCNLQNHPLQTSILKQNLQSLKASNLIQPFADDIHPLAIKIAESISGFEFIRDINATGLTIGIESDIESSKIIQTAKQLGLRLGEAGPTAVRIQPPLSFTESEENALIERISCTMEILEREFSDTTI